MPVSVRPKKKIQIVTRGCETAEMTLRRNAVGQLGFHVNFEGVVADVEPFGFAWQAGLRQGCRLVEICKVTVAMLSHEQMIDLLRTCSTVTVVVVHPHEDGTPRRYIHTHTHTHTHLCLHCRGCSLHTFRLFQRFSAHVTTHITEVICKPPCAHITTHDVSLHTHVLILQRHRGMHLCSYSGSLIT